jgi:hypothetical protein
LHFVDGVLPGGWYDKDFGRAVTIVVSAGSAVTYVVNVAVTRHFEGAAREGCPNEGAAKLGFHEDPQEEENDAAATPPRARLPKTEPVNICMEGKQQLKSKLTRVIKNDWKINEWLMNSKEWE